MFKGNTELKLNESTMILAVQEYLDKRMSEGYRNVVKSIKAESHVAYGTSFIVALEESKPPT